MVENIRKKLNDSVAARWSVVFIVAITMFAAYYITDVISPLKNMLESQFKWDSSDYGIFASSYGWFNVMLLMLIFGGIILDKMGIRFTGKLACTIMVIGCGIKYYAISTNSLDFNVIGIKAQVLVACIGFAIFGVGAEIAGISINKIIAKWFKGHEIALAMGVQIAIARLGTALALSCSLPIAKYFNNISTPILFGLALLCIGLLTFITFTFMDRKLDNSIEKLNNSNEEDESFKFSDVFVILKNRGFWLIAILCVLFYSAVFPFLKYAADLMINKYNVESAFAGTIPSILPFGTILLTPLFGLIYDKIGKGTTIMIIGSILLISVHLFFALPILNTWWFATALMIVLGIAFSLIPSAMWPSVPKIIPQNKLGTAYALIFWIQNWGLMGVPLLIGTVLNKYCIIGQREDESSIYNYTAPMIIFTAFGVLALIVSFLLKREDRIKNYGLEKPNIKE